VGTVKLFLYLLIPTDVSAADEVASDNIKRNFLNKLRNNRLLMKNRGPDSQLISQTCRYVFSRITCAL